MASCHVHIIAIVIYIPVSMPVMPLHGPLILHISCHGLRGLAMPANRARSHSSGAIHRRASPSARSVLAPLIYI